MHKYILLLIVALAAATMLTLMAVTLEPPQLGGFASPLRTSGAATDVFNPTPWV